MILIYEIAYYHLLLEELNFLIILMYCDGKAAFFLLNNLTFHEHTKHIEIDSQIIHHWILMGLVTTLFISSSHQLINILTNRLSMPSYNSVFRKLVLFDLYALAWGESKLIQAQNRKF